MGHLTVEEASMKVSGSLTKPKVGEELEERWRERGWDGKLLGIESEWGKNMFSSRPLQ